MRTTLGKKYGFAAPQGLQPTSLPARIQSGDTTRLTQHPHPSVGSSESPSRMKRRQFLKTQSAGLTVSASGANLNHRDRTSPPRVFLFNDGRHCGGLDSFEPPLTPEDHLSIADQLVGSGVDALVLLAAGVHGTVLYPSRVADLWGDTVQQWDHYVWARTARVLRQLISDGHDPLKLLCDRCHHHGISIIPVSLYPRQPPISGGRGSQP